MSLQGPAIPANKRKAPELIGRYNWKDTPIPVSGNGKDFVSDYDKVMTDFLREAGAPGGTLTVYFKGQKVYSKGFGYADIDQQIPYRPNIPARISSLSKFLTQRAIAELVKQGQLRKDDKAVEILKRGEIIPLPRPKKDIDPRIYAITIQQLLDHKSGIRPGLDISEATSDDVCKVMGFSQPIGAKFALGYILGLPLDNDPGKVNSYSNFGYALLGKIIEIVSGKPYEQVVRDLVLAPTINPENWFVTSAYRKDKRDAEPEYYSTESRPTWDAFRWDIFAGAGGWVAPTDEIADFFQRTFPGNKWHYVLNGSYTGAVTLMRVHDNSLVYAAEINYRRGNDPHDNEVLLKKLEDATKALKLP